MGRGEKTRIAILEAGMTVAATDGLEALSIGRLANDVGLSKSGLFAHFRSKEKLQVQVLEFARENFVNQVVVPSLTQPRGEPRVRALYENWLTWGSSPERVGGCVFLQAAAEYDDREGPVRDFLVQTQRDWIDTLVRGADQACEEGHFRADTDSRQFAFELYAMMMANHFYKRLLADPESELRTRRAFESLITRCRKGVSTGPSPNPAANAGPSAPHSAAPKLNSSQATAASA